MSHHHHNYPNHGTPNMPNPTGGDSQSGSLYSEGTTVSPAPTNVPNTNITARRTPVPCDPLYYPPVQQQQTYPPNSTYPSYQQISGARYHSDSYNEAPPASGSTDPRYPPLNVPGDGRWQGESYHASHLELQIPPPSDLRTPHSVYSPVSSFLQYQSPASSAHTAEHSPLRGAVHAVTATNTQRQQSVGMSHAFLERTASSSRGPMQLPNARITTSSSPVPHDVLPDETSEPTIKKKRKRADARQLEALNRMYARTKCPSTEERQQLASEVDMSARSVQIWFKNKRQASRQLEGGRIPPSPPISRVTVTLLPPVSTTTVLVFLAGLAGLAVAFVVARSLRGAAA